MAQKSYGLCSTIREVEALVTKLITDGRPFGFDIETGYDGDRLREKASLHPEQGFIVGFSVSNDTQWARYVPLRHDLAVNVDPEAFAKVIWPLMQTGLGVAHNAKFEASFLYPFFREHVPESGDGSYPIRSDTQVESYMLQETRGHGLKQLVKEHFGHDQAELTSLFPDITVSQKKAIRFNTLELSPKVVSYACEDAAWCLALHERNFDKVKDMLLFKTELELIPILVEMERFGLRYDWTMMSNAAHQLEAFMPKWHAEIMAELSEILGEPININLGSSQQVSNILYDRIGLSTTRMTGGENPKMSTNAIALEGLGQQYPYVRKMVEWREMKKLLGTYLQAYEGKFNYASDGRTHPSHSSLFILTGRFAVSDPAYQQTPKDYHYELATGESFDFEFRKVIQAGQDHYFVGFDYSQVELRWLAGEAQEPSLIADFAVGSDVHKRTASLMLGKPLESVTKDERSIGKTMNFALLYGMGVKSLGERLGKSTEEARKLMDQYFSAFSAIKVWSDRTTRQGVADGFTRSKFGRKHKIWELEDKDNWIRAKGERMCVNAPIQGGAADYMKVAMVRAVKALQKEQLTDRVHLVMNIHDALVFEVHKSVKVQDVINLLEPKISFPVQGFPPIEAEWGMGRRWGTMIDIILNDDGSISKKDNPEVRTAPTTDMQSGNKRAVTTGNTVSAASRVLATQPFAPHTEPIVVTETEPLLDDNYYDSHNPDMKATLPTPNPDTSFELIVELATMPTAQQLTAFKLLATTNPGHNTITLVLPDTRSVALPGTSGLSIHEAAQINAVLHGCTVHYSPDSIDHDQITVGLSF